MAKRSSKDSMGGYNATVWCVQNGTAFSVQVVEVLNGRIVRSNGSQCHPLAGTPAFHAAFVQRNGEFCGEPVDLFISNGTKGYVAAIGQSIHKAFVAQNQRPLTVEGIGS